ncbi:manganese efflux pump MntP family protein [Candidatus Bathyarchaeota archaeon]|nr:manganese efflux pump MntP family protein [Candidatus Bathyarchaeota archaeon]TFH16495.1 MAG: manganese efflux pump [Candidatus Bathyarchaeota archaeon]
MSQSIDLLSLILLSTGLAMDAFSVAIVAGFGLEKVKLIDSLRVSLTFGIAHIIMPVLGWVLGSTVIDLIQRWDHWLAFILLAFIGVRMIREGLNKKSDEINSTDLLGLANLIMFTVSVSIDALAVGLSFSLQDLSIWIPSLYFCAGTFIFTFIGLNMGNKFGQRFGKNAQIVGGLVLTLIGLRIIITHLFG